MPRLRYASDQGHGIPLQTARFVHRPRMRNKQRARFGSGHLPCVQGKRFREEAIARKNPRTLKRFIRENYDECETGYPLPAAWQTYGNAGSFAKAAVLPWLSSPRSVALGSSPELQLPRQGRGGSVAGPKGRGEESCQETCGKEEDRSQENYQKKTAEKANSF